MNDKNIGATAVFSRNDGQLIALLSGYLDSDNSGDIGTLITAELDKDPAPLALVCDVSGITYLSSTGIAMFVNLQTHTANRGMRFYLLGVQKKIRDVITRLGFDGFFQFVSSLKDIHSD